MYWIGVYIHKEGWKKKNDHASGWGYEIICFLFEINLYFLYWFVTWNCILRNTWWDHESCCRRTNRKCRLHRSTGVIDCQSCGCLKKPLNIWPAPVSWPSAGSCAFIQVLRSEPCHRFADVVPRLTPFSPFNLTYLEYLVRLGLHSAVFRQTQRQWWHSTIPSLAVSQADHMQETPGRVAAWQLKSAAMTPSGKKISRKTDCNCSNNIQMFLLFPHPWIFFTWCIYRDILIMAFTLRW